MMANRLLQLHRVLKPTGSLYLHCDPAASHYLRIAQRFSAGKMIFNRKPVPTGTKEAHAFIPKLPDALCL